MINLLSWSFKPRTINQLFMSSMSELLNHSCWMRTTQMSLPSNSWIQRLILCSKPIEELRFCSTWFPFLRNFRLINSNSMFPRVFLSSNTSMDLKQLSEDTVDDQFKTKCNHLVKLLTLPTILRKLQTLSNWLATSRSKLMSPEASLNRTLSTNSRTTEVIPLRSRKTSWEKESWTLWTHTMRSERSLPGRIQTLSLKWSTTHSFKPSKSVSSKRNRMVVSTSGSRGSSLWPTFACFTSRKERSSQESSRS